MEGIFAHNAHTYVRAGFSVYPLLDGARVPCTSHGFKDATRDASRVKRWASWRPNANVAVLTGKDANITEIDVDTKNGGFQTLTDFARQGKTLPLDAYYTTPSGGWHILYQYHPALRTGANRLGKGIDFVNDGAGTPVPPSKLDDGRGYCWQAWPAGGFSALPRVPEWVLDYVYAVRRKKEAETAAREEAYAAKLGNAGPVVFSSLDDLKRRRYVGEARTIIADKAKDLAKLKDGQGRNDFLFRTVCRVGRYVHHGVIPSSEMLEPLIRASKQCGLIKDKGIGWVERTIADGLARSKSDELPRLKERPRKK